MRLLLPLFAAALLSVPHFLIGQSLEQLFVSFPGKILGRSYTQETKQAFLRTTEVGARGKMQPIDDSFSARNFKLAIFDKKNGFLRLDDYDNYADFCYWRKSDGHRLVAVCNTTTVAYLESEIEFYDYYQGEWTKMDRDSIFPDPKYWDVLDIRATIADNQGAALPLDRFSYATEIQLPQKGKNILVRFEMVDFSDETGKELDYELVYKKERGREDHLQYFWNDGVFLKE